VNPLINWIWAGIGIMFFGTFIALLPERSLAFATAKVPQGAVTTLLVIFLVLAPGIASAQHVEGRADMAPVLSKPIERDLGQEIICMCGTCGRKRVGECFCPKAVEMRAEIKQLVAEGKTRDEVYAYFMAKYGSQEPLAKPIDKGFNRLAWLFPYLLGTGTAMVTGFTAFRWSRRREDDPSQTNTSIVDPLLKDRLDDELDELD
jgi:cytochrome c-type biogenesis protein CcmH